MQITPVSAAFAPNDQELHDVKADDSNNKMLL
jgi:hypothetical protein